MAGCIFPEIPYLIDYSLGYSTSSTRELSLGLDIKTLEEIVRKFEEDIECVFRDFFKEQGFSLKDGDYLFLPESLGIYIPRSLRYQIMASKHVNQPMFVRKPPEYLYEYEYPKLTSGTAIRWIMPFLIPGYRKDYLEKTHPDSWPSP
jgi:hypothetical protein